MVARTEGLWISALAAALVTWLGGQRESGWNTMEMKSVRPSKEGELYAGNERFGRLNAALSHPVLLALSPPLQERLGVRDSALDC